MTSRELFEMASLDVLGLLDERERQAFEEAFRAAPPHIQAQVRAEQARYADAESILPQVEPPAGLRAKVLAAVREAIAAVRTEPIARIGMGGVRAWSSAPLWRAACIGFATASLVLGVSAWHFSRTLQGLYDTAMSNNNLDDVVRMAGPRFVDMLARPTMKHVAFVPAAKDAAGRASAALYLDTGTKTAFLVCSGMRISAGSYRLVIESPSGGAQPVKEFQAASGTFFVPVEIVSLNDLQRLRIQSPLESGQRPATLLVASGV